jgi:chromosome segregation ATPase
MQETIDQSKEKNDEISILLAQKENSVKELTKELDEIKTQIKENKTSVTTLENINNKYDSKTNNESIVITNTGSA